ncbi:site-specific integrase [Acidobacteria bacterium AH-259-D05]|nr:site-specific integrase [Acidobacteria bacterium AH-259-D05]
MVKQKLPNCFGRDELVKLFNTIEDPLLAMPCLLAVVTGMRVGEIASLKWLDINLDSLKIRIVDGKNGDGYVDIPDDPALIRIFKKWKYLTRHQKCFLPCKAKRLDSRKNILQFRFHRALKKAGLLIKIGKFKDGRNRYRLSFHDLRHTHATLTLEKTGDIYHVQKSMRHTSVKSTEIYLHVSDPVRRQRTNQAWNTRRSDESKSRAVALPAAESPRTSPLEVLQLKFVNGEISKEDYLEKLALLNANNKLSHIESINP